MVLAESVEALAIAVVGWEEHPRVWAVGLARALYQHSRAGKRLVEARRVTQRFGSPAAALNLKA